MDFNYGLGHLLAKAPDGADKETEKYIDEMRTGSVIDANIKVFPTRGFGVGLKYNQYKTSNSIASLAEDNIRVRFVGLSLTANSEFQNIRGYSYVDFSVGWLNQENNAMLLNEKIDITGSTVGLYLSGGIDFLLSDVFSIGFQCGLMGGTIDELNVNGQIIELDEPDSLFRLDGTTGLKLYL